MSDQKIHGVACVGAAILGVTAIMAIVHTPYDVNECSQTLHKAHARGFIRSTYPVGYDRDGRPAIVLSSIRNNVHSKITAKDVIDIAQAAECVYTKGKRISSPINIVWDDPTRSLVYRYDGRTLK